MALEEFNHFFRDNVNDIYVEYTSSKQKNREKKFLKEKHFVPDKNNPKTGTIDSTEIDPKTGKPIRVKFSFERGVFDHAANARGTDYIHMDEKELQKHPSVSRSTFAHEDGHLILNRDPKKSSDAVEKITSEIQKSSINKLMNDHGNSVDEYIADRNSLYKVGYNETVRMLKHLRDTHLPKAYDRMRKSINKNPYNYILSEIGQSDLKNLPTEALFLVGLGSSEKLHECSINRYKDMIKSELAFKQKLVQEKKYNDKIGEFIDSQITKYRKEIDDLNIKIKKSKEERREIHQKFVNSIKANTGDELKLKKELLDGVDELEKQNMVEMDFRIKMLSFWNADKHVTESYYGPNDDDTSGTSEFDEPYNDDPDDCYCESSIFDDEDTDTEYDWLATKLDNEVAFWLEKCYNLWTSVPDIVYSSDSFGVDIIDYLPDDWELAVTTPDIWKELIDQTIRCSNAILYTIDEFDKLDPEQKMKHEGVKFDHDELIENINQIIQLANNVKSLSIFNILDSQHVMSAEEKAQVNDVYEVGNLFKAIAKDWVSKYKPNRLRYFQESSIPRSNEVYTNGGSIEKINNFQFDKVYFGSPNKLSTTMKLDGPLFVSPYPGIASIFSVRPQNLSKYGVQRGQRVNRDYDEWNRSLIDTVLQKPLRELHVRLQGDGLNIKPTTELVSGYLYTIDITPEIKDHIYQSSKMSKVFEFCIDKINSITFSDIKKINVRMTVTGENRPVQEAYDAITGKEIPIDHAYTMDEMKERTYTEEELVNTIQEAKLPSKKRNKLPDSDFALVYTDGNGKKIRKYPIHDEAHCRAAAHMFPRGVPLKYKATVARKILRRAHEFGIDTSGWKNLNKFK
jgi:hypothetical protein